MYEGKVNIPDFRKIILYRQEAKGEKVVGSC